MPFWPSSPLIFTNRLLVSVLGIIAIPGMMTGAILGGSSVEQAARLQMVIMFMIAASSALASIAVTVLCLLVIVDSEQRVRVERVDERKHWVWRGRDWVVGKVGGVLKEVWVAVSRRKGEEGNGLVR